MTLSSKVCLQSLVCKHLTIDKIASKLVVKKCHVIQSEAGLSALENKLVNL